MGYTDADRRVAREIIKRYPHAKSALLPLLHLAQDRDGWIPVSRYLVKPVLADVLVDEIEHLLPAAE